MHSAFGLIGQRLGHSFSKIFFTNFFLQNQIDANYELYELQSIDEVASFLNATACNALNITIPYKVAIIPFLHSTTLAAQKIGAVNAIKKIEGKWYGHNTDAIGFEKSFLPKLDTSIHKKALVLGNGGAAKAVKYILRKLNIAYVCVTRKAELGTIHYSDIDKDLLQQYQIIINTTPLGMHPHIESCAAIPFQFLNKHHYCYDLVYNPESTVFLEKSKAQECTIQGGLDMLYMQAIAAYNWWNNPITLGAE